MKKIDLIGGFIQNVLENSFGVKELRVEFSRCQETLADNKDFC